MSDTKFTPERIEAANNEVARLQRELDITNADHIALWIEANTIPDEPMSQCASWLACRIVEAHEAALSASPTPDTPLEGEVTAGANGQSTKLVWIDGKHVEVDADIAAFVAALNSCGFGTVASCSGHGHRPCNIALSDGREIIIARDFNEARKIDALFPTDINGQPTLPVPQGEVETPPNISGWSDPWLAHLYLTAERLADTMRDGTTEKGLVLEAMNKLELADTYVEKRKREDEE